MFVILLKYKKPIEVVDQHLVEHRNFLSRCYESRDLLCSGPQNPRTGGVILARTESLEQLKALFNEDPFYKHDVADYQYIEFDPVKHADDFAKCMSKS